jgi:hypothetical protein
MVKSCLKIYICPIIRYEGSILFIEKEKEKRQRFIQSDLELLAI